jgi:hypothetical protein
LLLKLFEEENQPNKYKINDFSDVVNEVEVFVMVNIKDMTNVRVNQTEFRLIYQKALNQKLKVQQAQKKKQSKKVKNKIFEE